MKRVPEVIRFDNVSFRYPDDEDWIFDNLSFSIDRGEKVVLTGPSGSGKTTMLYLCNRLYPENCDGVVKGSVVLFDKESRSYLPGEVNHRIATVFQDPDAQFCMPTVEEELAFTLE
ncbi:MAG TPA: ATP-binding cassette domain-containing protein, partial [Sporosarcina sp.]|nr:ATP-binding cassette domain-containing protein [Sporosarcina sp.]